MQNVNSNGGKGFAVPQESLRPKSSFILEEQCPLSQEAGFQVQMTRGRKTNERFFSRMPWDKPRGSMPESGVGSSR